jgi:hypothetical protein
VDSMWRPGVNVSAVLRRRHAQALENNRAYLPANIDAAVERHVGLLL